MPVGARALYLSGLMGSGKSAVGRLLAAKLGAEFVDTDREIEEREGMEVAEIFRLRGEAAFRAIERDVIASLPDRGVVVSLGGGAVMDPGSRDLLAARGRLFWLAARPETLARRTAGDGDRPLLAGLDEAARVRRLADLLTERTPAYADRSTRIDTDARTPEDVRDAILAHLQREAEAIG